MEIRTTELASALIQKHHPSGDVLTELKAHLLSSRSVAAKCEAEWGEDGDVANREFQHGRWDAYHDVIRTIERLEAQL